MCDMNLYTFRTHVYMFTVLRFFFTLHCFFPAFRSGKYCYKPTMNMTCCPQYTIRCDVPNFKLSKSQKKIIKRVNRYLITGQKPGSKDSGDDDSANAGDEGPSGDSFVPGKKSEFSLSASDVKNDRTSASEKPSASEKKGNVGSESKKADVKESVDEKADKKTSPKSAPTKGTERRGIDGASKLMHEDFETVEY
eukprot:GHVL01030044.1.p1 GENE.GHVL01030044.1~~GHVL01030044.1.p1  ORF type:complete len:194 (-),score=16.30 GHVL01030044.1:149-730(-)